MTGTLRVLWPAWVAFAIGALLLVVPLAGMPRSFAADNQRMSYFLLFWGLVAVGFGVWRIVAHRDRGHMAALIAGGR